MASDHSWETPARTAGRLILTGIDRPQRLLSYGLAPSWVCEEFRNPGWFRVALRKGKNYQVFVDIPWLPHIGRGRRKGAIHSNFRARLSVWAL